MQLVLNLSGSEQVQKKLLDFFDSYKLKFFDSERILIDQMIPFDPDALYAVSYQI
jgi:hypothetical protein